MTLLDRSRLGGRRSASLTPAGRLLAQHASRLADVLADAERDLATLTGQAAGTVTVGTFPTVIRHLVAYAAAAAAPSVRVRIRQVDYEQGLAGLKAGALDLFITDSDAADPPRDQPGARVLPLLTDPYQLAVPRAWSAGLAVAVIPALALPSTPDPDIALLPAAVLGARRLDLLHRRSRREPSPAAQIVIEAIRARAVTIVQPPPPDLPAAS